MSILISSYHTLVAINVPCHDQTCFMYIIRFPLYIGINVICICFYIVNNNSLTANASCFWGLVVLDNISLIILGLLLYGHNNKSTILSLIINLQICKKEIYRIPRPNVILIINHFQYTNLRYT